MHMCTYLYLLAWLTPAAEAEAETEEFLRSSVNHKNRDGSTSGCSTEAETEGTNRSAFSSGASSILLLSILRR